MLTPKQWRALQSLPAHELKSTVFDILAQAALLIQQSEPDDPDVLGVVPRMAALLEARKELESFRGTFSSLARSVGLLNYIDRDYADPRDEIAAEITTIDGLGLTLHREQYAAYNKLIGGANLILSAPTSFGKSALIDAVLLSGRYRRVAIVLPTIALLDEFRRRMVSRFGKIFDVVMHHSEKVRRPDVIFLGTQERLINRDDIGALDLLVVDEFYKLDPARKDERSVTLNAAVYKLIKKSKQFFFLGPNIDSIVSGSSGRWNFEFLKTRYSTVAVDTYDLKNVDDKEKRLKQELQRKINWPALVFVSAPDKANRLAEEVASSVRFGQGDALAGWMRQNYGPDWELADHVAAGIGVHHGRIPRALASRFVAMFNSLQLPILLCTSTLIEGVNTAAKSVLIYDKKISRSNYDFFTYSNIRGRAGRLGQHAVGNVFLFHAPPDEKNVGVDAPLFGDFDDAPDEFVVHIDEEDISDKLSNRLDDIAERMGIPSEDMRRFSTVGFETMLNLKIATRSALQSGAALNWRGNPDFNDIWALCKVICEVRGATEFGCFSDKQLAHYISNLRSKRTMKEFYNWHFAGYKGDHSKKDNVFKFLRTAEYSLPEYVSVIEFFVNRLGGNADYSLFTAELPRWFRPEELKVLEEQGVPIQISERFYRRGDSVRSLGERLQRLALSDSDSLSPFERAWIRDALPTGP